MTSQPFPRPDWLPTTIELANATVNVRDTVDGLRRYLAAVAEVHFDLFDLPLVITSGNDAAHATNSKHASNKAVDIRSHDKQPEDQAIFGAILCLMAQRYAVGVFDERALGSPHWHVEVA